MTYWFSAATCTWSSGCWTAVESKCLSINTCTFKDLQFCAHRFQGKIIFAQTNLEIDCDVITWVYFGSNSGFSLPSLGFSRGSTSSFRRRAMKMGRAVLMLMKFFELKRNPGAFSLYWTVPRLDTGTHHWFLESKNELQLHHWTFYRNGSCLWITGIQSSDHCTEDYCY